MKPITYLVAGSIATCVAGPLFASATLSKPNLAEGQVRPAAVFDAAYQESRRGKLTIEVPEVYELINIAIALTPTGRTDPYMVMKDSPYYSEVLQHFTPMIDHPFIAALEAKMKTISDPYFELKMNGYAFDYTSDGTIVPSPVYDRTGFPESGANPLAPLLPLMNDFSRASGFRQFYSAHCSFYKGQIAYIQTQVDVDRMRSWLIGHFPSVKPYDSTKIIFSPLVHRNQSVTWLESNGFRELQPHVNFPYPRPDEVGLSSSAAAVKRGNILFTEINHGFINPTADRYAEEIDAAIGDLGRWRDFSKGRGYNSPYSTFNEYMNWGLVDLYYTEFAPGAEVAQLIELNHKHQRDNRGFSKYPQFSNFLVALYRDRPAGTTIAGLYPQIINWFALHRNAPTE